jgi:hypothetical protein
MSDAKLYVNITLALGFGVVGIYFLGQGFLRLIRSNPELTWLPVSGRIVESRVDQGYRGGKTARIRYTYQHQGVSFESNRIAPLEFWSNVSSAADKFVEKYPSGQTLMVYVNQSDPKQAVLEPTNQPLAAVVSIFAGIALGLTTAMTYFMLVVTNN